MLFYNFACLIFYCNVVCYSFDFLQHANGENAWIGIDGVTGEIADMKEKKVGPFLYLVLYSVIIVYYVYELRRF